MMKFTPETSQSDSNSSNANFSVSLAVMPIVQNVLKRSVTNCIKLSHLQKSSPIRVSLGFKRFFNSSAPTLRKVQLERTPILKSNISRSAEVMKRPHFHETPKDDNLHEKKMLDRADAIDNKKMYTRLVSLLHGKQYCAERVNRVSDADWEAENTAILSRRKENLSMTAALSQAGNLDITKCLWKSLNDYFPTEAELGPNNLALSDIVAISKIGFGGPTNMLDVIDDLKNLNREKELKDLVAEINDMKTPNNMLVNADAIDNFKKLDRADAIEKLNSRLRCVLLGDRLHVRRVEGRLSDADWEAETAVLVAITKEVFKLTVALSLEKNVDISKCRWKLLNDYFPVKQLGIKEKDFNDLVADILKSSA